MEINRLRYIWRRPWHLKMFYLSLKLVFCATKFVLALQAVQILLIHDADMFLYDNTGRNAFHLAVATGNNRLVQMFLSMTDEDLKIINSQDL